MILIIYQKRYDTQEKKYCYIYRLSDNSACPESVKLITSEEQTKKGKEKEKKVTTSCGNVFVE
jgi:hypothetical protein